MNQWFVKRDADEIRNNAYIWKECNTEDARKNHVFETFVRWSEIYLLPYFDPTKFLIVDPMHCLFLGIAKCIVTRLWIEENRLTTKHLEIMQEWANKIKVPSDIGRIPNKIATGDGLLPTSGRLSSLYMLLQLLGTYLKMRIEKYYLILYERVISLYVVLFSNRD